MILHLFCIFNLGVNAVPISSNRSDIDNSKFDVLSKNRTNILAAGGNILSIIANIQVPEGFNLTKVAKDIKDLGIDDLKDEKHIEGLPLNRQGKINRDYHKEIFLGNHELFESMMQSDVQKRNQKLEEIFNQADHDHDQRVSHDELLNHIFQNVQQHSKEAKDQNSRLFILIDTNQDGKVTWHEYAALYVKFHQMNDSDIKDLNDIDFIQESFDEDLQQELLKIRYRWTEADGDNDYQLNLDEFLAFRHPEISSRSYKYIVDDIISQMDRDNDLQLTEAEFVFVPPQQLESQNNDGWLESDRRWAEQQKIEFEEMDENKDRILSREELLKAYDPLNRAHFNIQITRLFSQVDDSPKDDYLSLEEIQNHAEIFADMQFFDTDKKFHQEM